MSIFSIKDRDREKSPLLITKRPFTFIPPIRLNIQEVEKALQAECKPDRRLQQAKTSKLTMDLLNSSRTNPDWLPLFDLPQQENDSAKENEPTTTGRLGDKDDNLDHQLDKISLKRFQPISLFETSKRKLQKTIHDDMNIVLDKQNYLPLFQQCQKWRCPDSAPFDQGMDDSSVARIGKLNQSTYENQPQRQQRRQEQEQQDTIDILEEVLGETDYNSRSRIIVPTMKKQGSLSSSTHPLSTSLSSTSISSPPPPVPTTEQISPAPAMVATAATSSTEPLSAVPPKSPTTDATPTFKTTTDTSLLNHADSQLGAIPRQNIPVFGTPLQCEAVKKEISRLTNFSTSFLKHHVGKMMDILNHPLIAVIPDYTDPDDSPWHGSGKTLLLQQLLLRLEERTQAFNLAIVCYDLNSEEFLMKLVKPRYPVQRLNTLKEDEWDQEYGVVIQVKKSQSNSPKSTWNTKVDLAIIMDIRVQSNDSVMNMFQNPTSTGPPPIVSLVTSRSVELRMQDYINKLSPPKWRLLDQVSCESIFDTSNDAPVENSGLLTYMVVDSVIRWIDSGMKTEYQFANHQNAAPLVDTDRQSSTLPSPSPRSPTDEHQQQNGAKTTELRADLRATGTSPSKLNKNRVPEPTADVTANTAVSVTTNTTSDTAAEIIATTIANTAANATTNTTSDNTPPSLQDDLANLFNHASLERLQHDLKSYKSHQGKSSNQHYSARSDDEDSFYSAKSDSLSDDNVASKIQAVVDSLTGTFANSRENGQSSDMLKSLKMEFDKKCLSLFQSLVTSYQKSVMELQKEYVAEAEKKLALPSTSTTDS